MTTDVRVEVTDHVATIEIRRPPNNFFDVALITQLDAAVALATDIASSAPLAIRSIRHTMRGALVDEIRAATIRERTEQERLMASADWREGISAAAERRPPAFQGR